jgi:hypothetical protein
MLVEVLALVVLVESLRGAGVARLFDFLYVNCSTGVAVDKGIKSAVVSECLAEVGVGSKAGLAVLLGVCGFLLSLVMLIVLRLPVLVVVYCWILGCVVFLFEEVRLGES